MKTWRRISEEGFSSMVGRGVNCVLTFMGCQGMGSQVTPGVLKSSHRPQLGKHSSGGPCPSPPSLCLAEHLGYIPEASHQGRFPDLVTPPPRLTTNAQQSKYSFWLT